MKFLMYTCIMIQFIINVWCLGFGYTCFVLGGLWRIVWYVHCEMIVWVWMDDGMLWCVRGK
jgi:hypothetical protein